MKFNIGEKVRNLHFASIDFMPVIKVANKKIDRAEKL